MAKRKLPKRKREFVPGSGVTYGQVWRDRKAEEQLRYGPIRSELEQRGLNTTNWFDTYKNDQAAKAEAQKAHYAQAVQGVAARGLQAQQASNQQTSQLDAELRADAASRGATYSGQPGQQAVAGADQRQQLVDLFANLLETQGVANTNYSREQGVVGSAAQLSERLKLQKAEEDVARDRGAFRQQYMGQRRQDEAKSVLERLIFGQDVAEAQNLDRDRRADNRRQRRQDKAAAEKEAYQRANKLGPYKPAATPEADVPKADVKVKANIRKAVRAVRNRDNGLPTYWGDSFNTLVDVDGLDPVVARAVIQFAKTGRLGAKTKRTLLEDYGIRANDFNFAKRKRPSPTPVADAPMAPGPNGQYRPN
jgi:hypothetical protein